MLFTLLPHSYIYFMENCLMFDLCMSNVGLPNIEKKATQHLIHS